MAETTTGVGGRPRTRTSWFVALVAWVAGLEYLVTGVWALIAPEHFARVLATFPPFNAHYLHDLGAFSIGLGAVLLIAVTVERRALVAALLGVGVASVLHGVSHVIDRHAGGNPGFDIPALGLLGVLLLVAGEAERRHRR